MGVIGVSSEERCIEHLEDIQVGRPLEREAIRAVDRGVLVTCTDSYCSWQGLFPEAELAKEAVESHYAHERRSGEFHYGRETYTIVRLLDRATAQTVDESSLGLSVEENRICSIDGDVHEVEFPRTTDDVDAIVQRGDVIRYPPAREGLVFRVTETRSYGLPTWTVVFVDRDVDLTTARKHDFRWKNELIAQDGQAYTSYGPDPLASPAFEVVGEAEHQADLDRFAGGVSA